MIYGYIRVSTDKQTVENQRFEIGKGVLIGSGTDATISSFVYGFKVISNLFII